MFNPEWIGVNPVAEPALATYFLFHPDSITARFNRLVDRAGARRIRLHDVRHTYATLSRDAGIDAKIIGDRIGHAKLLTDYVHASVGKDRSAAELIGKLIADALAADRDEDRSD